MDKQHILIVDDDPRVVKVLERVLRKAGYAVDSCGDGQTMHSKLVEQRTDCVLLDLSLPGTHGLELARELRSTDRLIGIIIVTGSGDSMDKVVGLEGGADDYVIKPFDERELLARLRSVLRRVRPPENTDDCTPKTFLNFSIDFNAHSLVRSGEPLELTSHEFALLSIFIKHGHRVLSRDQILDHLSDKEWYPNDRSVDVLVGKLRKKIEVDPSRPKIIKTIRGVGYKFAAKLT